LLNREVAGAPDRMEPGLEKRLVGIDISDSRDDALIEQYRFQAAVSRDELFSPRRLDDVKGLGS
jgi:hypothetical protein